MPDVIKTTLSITFEGKEIYADMAPDLLSFVYEDKEKDEADTLSLTLMDRDGKWSGAWCPEGGEKMEATIFCNGTSLPCGTFFLDSLRCSGAPRTVELSGVSVPLSMPCRRRKKTRAWEKTGLKTIAQQIAGEAGLALLWDTEEEPAAYDRIEQRGESDLEFLSRLCGEQGFSLKASAEKMVVFDEHYYEKKDPAGAIVLGVSPVLSWEFSTQKGQEYKSVRVAYYDERGKGDAKEVTVRDEDAGDTGQEYELRRKCATHAEAERLARAKLRELNSRAVTGSISVAAGIGWAAGEVLELAGFGAWDGRYIVEGARHSVSGSGYVTSLSLRLAREKY